MTSPNQSRGSNRKFDNESYVKNVKKGVRVSKLVADGPLIDSLSDAKTVFDVFMNTVKRSPTHMFLGKHDSLTGPYSWLSYKQVYNRVLECGSGFNRITENSHRTFRFVGLYASNCPEWLISELACWAYGQVAVPLYDTLGLDAIIHICNETKLSLVVCDSPARARCLVENQKKIPHVRNIVIIAPANELSAIKSDAGSRIQIVTFEEILTLGSNNLMKASPVGEDGLIVICYTSGTTGVPKGVMIENRNMIANIAATSALLGPETLSGDDVHLSFLPLAHIYEQFVEVYMMHIGARIGYYFGNILQLKEDFQALQPTLFTAVPRLLYRVYDAALAKIGHSKVKRTMLELAMRSKLKKVNKQIFPQDSLWDSLIFSKIRQNFGGNIRVVLITSAPIAPHVLRFTRAVFSCPVLEGYGSTESCGPASMSVAGDLLGGHVGSPLPSFEMKLGDAEEMNLVALRDLKGEICIRSRACTSGYYKAPDKTAELIDNDGWLHTGDIGVWDHNCLKIVDRCKHIFKLSQGEYVSPEQVEIVYLQSPLISQIFVDGDALYSFPVAVVVPELETLVKLISASKQKNDRGVKNITLEEVCKMPEAKSLIQSEMKDLEQASNLKGFEKVKNFLLAWEPFTIENNLLTPTLKAARAKIRQKYASELSGLYRSEVSQQKL